MGSKAWGWDSVNEAWVPLAVTAAGALRVVAG